MVILSEDPLEISPAEFELEVKGILDAASKSLVSYQSQHLNALSAADGEYIIDVTAKFNALGADFSVLVECKHHKRKVERQDVQCSVHQAVVAWGTKSHAVLYIRLSVRGYRVRACAWYYARTVSLGLDHLVHKGCW